MLPEIYASEKNRKMYIQEPAIGLFQPLSNECFSPSTPSQCGLRTLHLWGDLSNTSAGSDRGSNSACLLSGVGVWDLECAYLGDSGGGCASQDVVDIANGSGEIRIEISDHGEFGVVENVSLNVYLRTHARVDARSLGTQVVGVVHVSSSESD